MTAAELPRRLEDLLDPRWKGRLGIEASDDDWFSMQLRQRGAPIAWHVLAPAVARANGVAVPRRAPHPHAALLYNDFMLGDEAQKILVQRDFVPTSRGVVSPLANVPITLVDAGALLDAGDKWARLYDETVVRKSS